MPFERLFENLDVRVTPFALCGVAPGWRLQMGGPDCPTLHFVLEGEGALHVSRSRGGTLALGRYSLALVPPGAPHSLQNGSRAAREASAERSAGRGTGVPRLRAGPAGESDLRVACGRVEATYAGSIGLFDLLRDAIVLDFSDSARMRRIFEDLLEEQRAPSPGSEAMIEALMNQCLVLLFRRLTARREEMPWLTALQDPRMARAIEAVLKAPEQPHSLESLAAQAFMGRSAFADEFRLRFGRTPMRFVRDVRLREAARLLRTTDLSVGTVADRVGFASRSHFSAAFRDYFGLTPARFRRSYRGQRAAPHARPFGG